MSRRCIFCKEDREDCLLEHHIIPRSLGYDNDNTITLCENCHRIAHKKLVNPLTKLVTKNRAEIKKIIEKSPDEKFYIALAVSEIWSGRDNYYIKHIKTYIEEELGIEFSYKRIAKILRKLGFSTGRDYRGTYIFLDEEDFKDMENFIESYETEE